MTRDGGARLNRSFSGSAPTGSSSNQLRPPEIRAVYSLAEARDAFTAKSSPGGAGPANHPPALTTASGSRPARRASETAARRPRSTTAASVNATNTPIIATPNAKR